MTQNEHSATNRRRRARHALGVVLLEVVLALTLFVLAASVIGSALSSAAATAATIRKQSQAGNLAQTVLADLTTGAITMADITAADFLEDTDEGEVDVAPGWTYDIEVEEVGDFVGESPLKSVTVIVRNDDYNPMVCRLTQWMLDPAFEQDQDAADADAGGGGGR